MANVSFLCKSRPIKALHCNMHGVGRMAAHIVSAAADDARFASLLRYCLVERRN